MQIIKMRLINELMWNGAAKYVPIYLRVQSGALVPLEVNSVELHREDELDYIVLDTDIDAPDV